MIEQDRAALAGIMAGLAGNYGDQLDENTCELWFKVFKADDVSIDEVAEAAYKLVKSRKGSRMPCLAEMLELISGSAESQAEIQADLVLSALRTFSCDKKEVFLDTVTDYLMRFRWPFETWRKSLEVDEVKWWRKDFVRSYRDLRQSPLNLERAKQLMVYQSDRIAIEKKGRV